MIIRMAMLALCAFLLSGGPVMAGDLARATSPDGTIAVAVALDPDGRIQYRVDRAGKPVIAASKLGLVLTDALPLQRGFVFDGSESATGREDWEQPWGVDCH